MDNLKNIAKEYFNFPKTFLNQKRMIFVCKHGNLDRVKTGLDVIARVDCESITEKSLMRVKTKAPLKEGHVLLGIVGSKEIANAYVHEVGEGYALIGSMSSESL